MEEGTRQPMDRFSQRVHLTEYFTRWDVSVMSGLLFFAFIEANSDKMFLCPSTFSLLGLQSVADQSGESIGSEQRFPLG